MKAYTFALSVTFFLCSSLAFADELKVGSTYQLGITATNLEAVREPGSKYTALKKQ